eukprot:7382176-Prymnesium_polylepis.1
MGTRRNTPSLAGVPLGRSSTAPAGENVLVMVLRSDWAARQTSRKLTDVASRAGGRPVCKAAARSTRRAGRSGARHQARKRDSGQKEGAASC